MLFRYRSSAKGKSQSNLIAKFSLHQTLRGLLLIVAIAFADLVTGIAPTLAQSITPNNDGTGTTVNTEGASIKIEGGSLSEDGANLFHSFEQFGLSESQIADFMSNPNIRNILGRINGGDPSVINGLIQVTGGNSNLLLMNPAGIIFGESAQLNVPGDFTATTATGIGFENNLWFNAVGENNYQTLVGTPNTFAFDTVNAGAIINGADLNLAEGKNLTFVGGNVINTGNIQAGSGNVTLSAVPGSSTVKISQPGHVLSLEIEPPRDNAGKVLPFTPQDLPSLLTSSGAVNTGLTANNDGSVTINETATSFIPEATLAISTGEINVSGFEGGAVNITGNKVGLISGRINAQGTNAGGEVRVGGDYQGGDALPQATQTIVDQGSNIAVDATDRGDGGQIVVWSNSLTRFTGNVTARGGENGGDGGLVEVSGKDLLLFTGTVDGGAAVGQPGELLLDPKNITIGDPDSPLATLLNPNPEGQSGDVVGFAASVATVGEDLVVGSPAYDFTDGDETVSFAGQVFLFDNNGNFLRTYDNPNPTAGGFFGRSVATAGENEFLVGASRNTVGDVTEAGQVFLFNKDSIEPIQTYDNPNPNARFEFDFAGSIPPGDGNFGESVAAIGNDRILVGAPGHTVDDIERAGQGFLLDRNSGELITTYDNPNPSVAEDTSGAGNAFGVSVAGVADNLLIGAPGNSSGGEDLAGQAFLFNQDGERLQTFDNPNPVASGGFGSALAEVDNDVVIGAPRNASGEAFLFAQDGERLQTYENPSSSGSDFGRAIAVAESNDIIIGAPGNTVESDDITNSGAGQVFLLERDGTVLETLDNPNPVFDGNFGGAVAEVGTDRVLIGAEGNTATITEDELEVDDAGEALLSRTGADFGELEEIEENVLFETDPGSSVNLFPEVITNITDTGTDVTLQANNDLIVGTDQAITTDADGEGGNLTLQAGRNLAINADIFTDNGNLNLIANGTAEAGVIPEFRDSGTASIFVAEGVTLDAGTGNVDVNVDAGVGDRGGITVGTIVGNDISLATGSGTVEVNGTISASDNQPASRIAIAGDEINLGGGNDSVRGDNITLATGTPEQDINLGNETETPALDLSVSDITALNLTADGETPLNIGSPDSTGTVSLFDSVANGGTNPFQSSVALLGGDTLVAPDLDFSWDVDSGNLNNIFDNGLTYSNFENYRVGTIGSIDNTDNIGNELGNQFRNVLDDQVESPTAEERETETPTPIINSNISLIGDTRKSQELALLRRLDANFTQEYEHYYDREVDGGQQADAAELGVNVAQVQQTLKTIEESTGVKPALIYAAFFPAGIDALQGRNSNILPQADDQLELVTITAQGEVIRKQIQGVTRAEVDRAARRLTDGIVGIQPKEDFLPYSQELYQWLVKPLKADLEAQEISNLVFLMDGGLRSLPIAALHDGKQYLVEEYSVGLMPSISLTDTRYRDINGVDLLAMGSETFPADSNLAELPAVPVEIEIITQQLWSGGSTFLDADFTIDNLKQTQRSKPFGILHLATHAEFNPGSPKNSYIQFGDRKLDLDQVRELGLSNPQVELMVLSACKTALGDRDAEFGFAGLAHQAGVKSALGSLWSISDQGTLSLMSKFYQELKTAPIKAEALRRTQVAMINQHVHLETGKLITDHQTFTLPSDIEAIDLTHPFFWSPYTIIGNPW
jgi:filamentous hemagglutinin family protein